MVGIYQTGVSYWSPYLSGIANLPNSWSSSVGSSSAYWSPLAAMYGYGGFGAGSVGVAAAWAAYRIATSQVAMNWYGSPMMWRPPMESERRERRDTDQDNGERWYDKYASKHEEGPRRSRRGEGADEPDDDGKAKHRVTGTADERRSAARAMRGKTGTGFTIKGMNPKSGRVTIHFPATPTGKKPKDIARAARARANAIARKHNVRNLKFSFTGPGKPTRKAIAAPAEMLAKVEKAVRGMKGDAVEYSFKVTAATINSTTKVVHVSATRKTKATSSEGSLGGAIRRKIYAVAGRNGIEKASKVVTVKITWK